MRFSVTFCIYENVQSTLGGLLLHSDGRRTMDNGDGHMNPKFEYSSNPAIQLSKHHDFHWWSLIWKAIDETRNVWKQLKTNTETYFKIVSSLAIHLGGHRWFDWMSNFRNKFWGENLFFGSVFDILGVFCIINSYVDCFYEIQCNFLYIWKCSKHFGGLTASLWRATDNGQWRRTPESKIRVLQ